jgi:hypothetical protein
VSKSNVIDLVCQALTQGDRTRASSLAREQYPFTPAAKAGRRYSEFQMTQIFRRDGFVDRYSGERLIFPGTLRLLSAVMPEEFPAHRNWKMSESHIVYYELFPTIDHVVPVCRGGTDDETNWVTTSMLRNSAKGNWKLDELGWTLCGVGRLEEWDGLMRWFVEHTERNPAHLASGYLRRWRAAALRALGG